jgi:hypothetical protein
VSELSIQYRRSALTLERVLDGGPRAGERAPDALVRVVDGPLGKAPGKGRLFDLHDPGSFSLLLLVDAKAAVNAKEMNDDEKERAAFASDDLARFAEAVEARLPNALRVWRLAGMPAGEAPPVGGGAQSLDEAYGRTRPAFYLVRPDGYICARGRPASDLGALLRHCELWFSASAFVEPPPR